MLACALLSAGTAGAAELPRFLPRLIADDAFPGATRIGPPQGEPPVAPALADGNPIGYVFVTTDYVSGIGYSGKPIHLLVAIGNDAVIRRVTLLEHHEPIVLVGIPEARIRAMLQRYEGLDVRALIERGPSAHDVDIVSGATVTALVIDDSVIRAAIAVTRRLGLGGGGPPPAATGRGATLPRILDPAAPPPADWPALLDSGWVQRLALTVGDVERAFAAAGAEAAARPQQEPDDALFTELFVSLVTPRPIGVALLGAHQYRRVQARLRPGEQAILIAGRGRYSFKGSGYVRGGIFERFRVLQGERSIIFHDDQYLRMRRLAAPGAPDRLEVDVFFVPADAGFDPHRPWQVELLVHRAIGPTEKAFVRFTVDYPALARPAAARPSPQQAAPAPGAEQRPGQAAPEGPALWKRAWQAKVPEILALGVALTVLTAVFFFQMWFARRPRLLGVIRIGFLLFTLLGIGWYAKAQLSVVNILTVFNAWLHGFRWEYFLMDPLVFILWGSVFVSLILWGRGAYCGWLCPFGALQELTNRVARALHVPQWRVPWPLHERLWALKYLVFLSLFGVGIHSLATAERLAEVEPFKTAIIMGFAREWPFVTFALALLVAGLFVERFYCRYLCALGAALAIPARLRTFEWLKRYRQCGAPCQICANECMVQAIHPEGPINPHECLYCLHCQELYVDEHRCPVAIVRRERRERREARSTGRTQQELDRVLKELRAERARRDAD